MKRYSISQEAIQDLDEISDYLASFSIEAGEQFIQKFTEKCRHLVRFPNMGKNYPEIMPNLKGLILDNYLVFYQIKLEEVEIVRVVSGYRDLESVFVDDDT
ncbi:type II toxin-antitoxin system RelE/ParE family toxin [Roseofilum reptotaenium CS-1145]|uniref:Plasmid stabilization protein n=1 Tax=Roseofilum reptotaenium AO1-A TaxID=1925591 RepID=A0A1L9QV04_9CYAN|nr:type II toxin-antitoxin system RelE/ParE family toxin [Roseofilum reptotaenium]MDB9518714.1 type II toxin-antitoxin system RelE/ParE family toxin [Roseofilum reptotaenium CS-1145]OJJ26510.1 plasmid stabilization protein [Roseofilum reptotaenium AO1-A]